MNSPKRATRNVSRPSYDLRASQIETPRPIVKFFWHIVHSHRSHVGSVLDMGAGDGKFAQYGNYDSYTGIEIDVTRITNKQPRKTALVRQGCVFALRESRFDACIGNPPYLRHQDIESPWKEKTLAILGKQLGVELSGHSNLFLYFMALSLIRTKQSGIAALLVPFDWVSRPAARNLRSSIVKNQWNVAVYRFAFPVFDTVDTTASISVIDKNATDGSWRYFDVGPDLQVEIRRGVTGTGKSVLDYARRRGPGDRLFARRGLSPGTQQIFTLTEGERIHHGLALEDVVPCVTTLRGISEQLTDIDRPIFESLFVAAGRRCWLINSRERLSQRLRRYLEGVPPLLRATATCVRQEPWYKYEVVGVPSLLVHSGFTSSGPRIVRNSVGAIPVGSMYGIYGCPKGREAELREKLVSRRVLSRIVPHSRHLRKIEVGQLNGLLTTLMSEIDG